MKLLHVTESLGGGVLTALVPMLQEQSRSGASVRLAYISRGDTPAHSELRAMMGPTVEIYNLGRWKLSATLKMAQHFREDAWDVVHLHSSWAGLIGRLIGMGRSAKIVYSPHGFGFLRSDLSLAARYAIQLIEAVLGRMCAGLLCVSKGESEAANTRLKINKVEVVENSLSVNDLMHLCKTSYGQGVPTISCLGRVSYQKAPWRFAEIARELQSVGNFVWIGGGSENDISRWFGDSPVEITGWLDHDAALCRLSEADIFLLPSLWEGLPVSLMEAQVMGIPAVVSDVIGNRDIVEHGVSGYLFHTDAEAVSLLRSLVSDLLTRELFGRAAHANATERFDRRTIALRSLGAYKRLVS